MSELGFVIKSLIISIVLVLGLQVKVSDETLEHHLFSWIHGSAVGKYLTNVAKGGKSVVINGTKAVEEFISGDSSKESEPETVKAGRLDFTLKRSQNPKHSPSGHSGE